MRTHRPCRGCGETISAKYYLCIDCMHEKGKWVTKKPVAPVVHRCGGCMTTALRPGDKYCDYCNKMVNNAVKIQGVSK